MNVRLKQMAIRLFVSICIFSFTILLTPNFYVANIYILFIAGIFVVTIDYLISTILNIHDYPIGRGVIGFCSAILILYATQFFIAGYYISVISSIIAASIYSITDYVLPNYEDA